MAQRKLLGIRKSVCTCMRGRFTERGGLVFVAPRRCDLCARLVFVAPRRCDLCARLVFVAPRRCDLCARLFEKRESMPILRIVPLKNLTFVVPTLVL